MRGAFLRVLTSSRPMPSRTAPSMAEKNAERLGNRAHLGSNQDRRWLLCALRIAYRRLGLWQPDLSVPPHCRSRRMTRVIRQKTLAFGGVIVPESRHPRSTLHVSYLRLPAWVFGVSELRLHPQGGSRLALFKREVHRHLSAVGLQSSLTTVLGGCRFRSSEMKEESPNIKWCARRLLG